jgi:hypothetical protein
MLIYDEQNIYNRDIVQAIGITLKPLFLLVVR